MLIGRIQCCVLQVTPGDQLKDVLRKFQRLHTHIASTFVTATISCTS